MSTSRIISLISLIAMAVGFIGAILFSFVAVETEWFFVSTIVLVAGFAAFGVNYLNRKEKK